VNPVRAESCERSLKFERQRPLAVLSKGVELDCVYRLERVVKESIRLEFKAVERLLPIHEAQVIT
jgi:GxxExxY protein